ncbi:MAG: tRNA (adenosine(37)-N6)-dimethylallyltransferase MiaA [Microgenomates group bacterium]
MKRKILVICGPTATGKTSLGISLAKKFDGEIVSADSRQVYRHMDIGTGKEWDDEVKIWGYDLAEPNEKYNVSDYFREMKIVVSDIWDRNKLPIIVGGTGLYIKSLIDGIPTVDIPKNENLRQSIENLTVQEMYEKLATLDSSKAASLNASDKNNPRRLVRAIEVAVWNIENETQKIVIEKRENVLDSNVEVLTVGLTAENSVLLNNIENRVENRMESGFIDEVEELLKMGISWKEQAMNSLGYKESEAFFKNGQTYEDFINLWIRNEMKYVKRQLTWFKKDKRVNWFDIKNLSYPDNVENLVNKWYSSITNGTKS